MFEDRTPERLQTEIAEGMGDTVQTREGSFLREMIGPVATEMSKIYQFLPAYLGAFYVDEGSGGFIDLACARYGIARKAGTHAAAAVHLAGRAGVTIPAGTAFLTAGGLEFDLDSPVTLSGDGTGEGRVTAAAVGDAYNVQAGELTQMVVTLTGLDRWANDAAQGGTDAEEDSALVGRLYDYWRKPSTSGNIHDYEQWALEMDGVGAVKVQPLWNGPGTVKVLLAGPERQPVDNTVVSAVAGHIEGQRPIGAAVTVVSAQSVDINVTARLTLDGSVSLADAKAALVSKLDTYLQSVAFVTNTVLYNRIAFLVLDIDGVVDYTSLTVNGGTGNVALTADRVPVLGTVTLA